MQEKGLHLISEGKMAIVLLLNEKENQTQTSICDPGFVQNEAAQTSTFPFLQKLLSDDDNFVKVANYFSLFVIVFCFWEFSFVIKFISMTKEVYSLILIFLAVLFAT